VTTEPSGTNCENGGIKIDSGVDANGDGTLDDTEITATAYVCNGVDGNNSLTKITSEAAGANCGNGGLRIDTGVDSDSDGTLDDSEITATAYVCNGIDGNDGLIKTTNESAGANCENGGIKIDSGIDTNGDGTLDDTEITATAYVCNGVDGNNSLTKITSEASGANCENGGLRIDTGVDSDSDGTLGDSEITATTYACNGLDGNVSLVNIADETAGVNCENGGVKIDSGIDDNSDGVLDSEEIDITRYICNGIDGGFDEQIRFSFNYSANTSSTTAVIGGELINFDKNFFVGVDSVVFSANPYVGDAINNALVELYNMTDDIVIANSLISTNQLFADRVFLYTGNLFGDLPETEIRLGVRFSSQTNGQFAASGTPYLFLYRSN
jgi:transcription elongation factor Elf1